MFWKAHEAPRRLMRRNFYDNVRDLFPSCRMLGILIHPAMSVKLHVGNETQIVSNRPACSIVVGHLGKVDIIIPLQVCIRAISLSATLVAYP